MNKRIRNKIKKRFRLAYALNTGSVDDWSLGVWKGQRRLLNKLHRELVGAMDYYYRRYGS